MTDSLIKLKIPLGAQTGKVSVTVNNIKSNEVDFTLLSNEVTIGTQIWMTKNLDVDHYLNGDSIPEVRDSIEWANLKTGAWCYYNNDTLNGYIYGKLYNWYAVYDPRGLAPAGWHAPSDSEWIELENFLGGTLASGRKLKSTGTKEAGTGLWFNPNSGATNESGFSAPPGGYRSNSGVFDLLGYAGYMWSTYERGSQMAWFRYLHCQVPNFPSGYLFKNYGFSVRCVKDK